MCRADDFPPYDVVDVGPWRGLSEKEWVDRIVLGAQTLGGWPTWPRPLIQTLKQGASNANAH